jgi:adenosylcobinamide-GDP ribazoletransferase
VKRLRAALVMLTRLPLETKDLDEGAFRASAAFHPWVGVLVGTIAAFAFALGSAVDHIVGALFALACGLLVTGAMHEDGLADCADAFFGTKDEEKARAILKDPRLGTFGACALFVVLGLRVVLLPSVLEQAMASLVFAATIGRFAMLLVLRTSSYAGQEETQKTGPVDAPSGRDLAIAALAPVCVAALALADRRLSFEGVLAATASALVLALAMSKYARKRLGGWVGDVLGATEQLAECTALFFLAALAPM